MWIWIADKFAKFHTKRINRSENIPKSFRGGYFFWNTLYVAPWRPKTQKYFEDLELNQTISKPDTVDRPLRTARTFVRQYDSTQYGTVTQRQFYLIFAFLQTNIISQMWPSGGKGMANFLIRLWNTYRFIWILAYFYVAHAHKTVTQNVNGIMHQVFIPSRSTLLFELMKPSPFRLMKNTTW